MHSENKPENIKCITATLECFDAKKEQRQAVVAEQGEGSGKGTPGFCADGPRAANRPIYDVNEVWNFWSDTMRVLSRWSTLLFYVP